MKDPSPLETIFFAALEKGSPQECATYLDGACAGDPDLRRRIEKMLAARAHAGSFLEQPAHSPMTIADEPLGEGPGTVIGSFKLLEPIGEGGFGVVFMAEQTQPVRRKVALKILKRGMDTRQVVARFEAERQALAIMDHPNIAQVYDGGSTPSGRPYFVMELVRGAPITEYCDEHHLTPRQRLELFIPVCQAVQHAHQKSIIHRDLKPSNVLVALYDGKPVPKVIDFGVAKAAGQPLTDQTLVTDFGAIVGTLEYMSPEQAEINQLDIDTRSDIYSLGVLLYELLTGGPPFTRKELEKAGMLEMLRVIREQEPSKPSTKLSKLSNSHAPHADGGTRSVPTTLASIAANRGTEPAKLTKLVRGELDWIVMKALEKDRNRRYETASGIALDVQHYLADEPVEACPPSVAYRMRKFARRHRGPVLAAAAVLATLVAGIIGTSVGLVRAERAKLRETERAAAEKQAKETAETVLDFVDTRIFAAARPAGQAGGLGRDVSLRKAIATALPYLKDRFKDQPLVEARLRMTVGISFLHLAEAATAREQLEAALDIYTAQQGAEHPDTLRCKMRLAGSHAALGRAPEAVKLFDETLAIQEAKLGPNHRDTLGTLSQKALAYFRFGRYDDALELSKEVLARRKAAFGREDGETLLNVIGVAATYQALGRHAEALKVLEEETSGLTDDKLEDQHLLLLTALQLRGDSHAALGQHDPALKVRQELFEKRKAKYGLDQPETLACLTLVAESLVHLGRGAEAVPIIDEFVEQASSKVLHQEVIPRMILMRFAVVRETKDPQSCRRTAEMWEKLKLSLNSVNGLYNAACIRAVTSAALRATDTSPDGGKQADAEADRAMGWLKQSVAAGFNDPGHLVKDTDLDALRDRKDFKELIAELHTATKKLP